MAIVRGRNYWLLLVILATTFERAESQTCESELRNQVVFDGHAAEFYSATDTDDPDWYYSPSSDPSNSLHGITYERDINSQYVGFYSVNSTKIIVYKATGQRIINSSSESSPDSTAGVYILLYSSCATAANLIAFDENESKCNCDPSRKMMICSAVYAESTMKPCYPAFNWYDSSGNLVFTDGPSAVRKKYGYTSTSQLPITGAGAPEYTCQITFGAPVAPPDDPVPFMSTNAPTFTKSYSAANCLMMTTASTITTTTKSTTTARATTIIALTTVPATTKTLLTTNTPTSTVALPVSTTASSSTVTHSSTHSSIVAGTTPTITAAIANAIVPATAPTAKVTVATSSVTATKLSSSATKLVTGSTVAVTTVSNSAPTDGSQPTRPAKTATATSQSKATETSVGMSSISASLAVSKATGITTTITNINATAGSRPTDPVQASTALSQSKFTGSSAIISAMPASASTGITTSRAVIQMSAAAITNTASITSSSRPKPSATQLAEIRTPPARAQPTQSSISATNLVTGSTASVVATTILNPSRTAVSSTTGTIQTFTNASQSHASTWSANNSATPVALSASTTTATTIAKISTTTTIVSKNCPGQNLANTVVYEGTQGVPFPRIDNGQPVQWQILSSSDFFSSLKIIFNFDGTLAPQYNTSFAVNKSQLTVLNSTVSPQQSMPIATAGLYILKYLNLNCTTAANLIVIRSGPTCGCDASEPNNVKLNCSVDFAEANSQPNYPIFNWTDSNSAVKEETPIPLQTSTYMKRSMSVLPVSNNDATLYQCRLTFGAAPQSPLYYVTSTPPIFTASCYVSNCLLTATKPDAKPTTTKIDQATTATPAITTATSAILTTLQTAEIVTTGSQTEEDKANTIVGLLGLVFATVLIFAIAFTCWMFRCSLY